MPVTKGRMGSPYVGVGTTFYPELSGTAERTGASPRNPFGMFSPEVLRGVQLRICENAKDVEDAKLLMEAMGFLPYESGDVDWQRRK